MAAMTVQHEKPWTILDILEWTTRYFRQKHIEPPKLTADVLLAHALEQDRMYLYVHFDQPLSHEERERFKALIRQRVKGVPTQYLTGRQEFWSLDFRVTPGVLIPRPETEHLVEAVLPLAAQFDHPSLVDIGTGSGILAISLQKELPGARIYASDISGDAVAIARENAERLLDRDHTIRFFQGDVFAPFEGMTFDLIVSNPPYIAAQDFETLAPEVREHEPKIALYAGEDGLDAYRRLIAGAHQYLASPGYILVEIGYGQQEAVAALFQQHGLTVKEVIKDYAGIDRVVVACQ